MIEVTWKVVDMTNKIEHRIFRCGKSDFNCKEILWANKTHTDEDLQAIADAGFNGIWVRGILRELVPTELFRPYVKNAEKRLESLFTLCQRASRIGLGVWLYLNEPAGMLASNRFWQDYPELAGHRVQFLDGPPQKALCTSTEEVKQFLSSGFLELLQKVPLTGIILITASEMPSHCWAHVLANPKTYPNPEKFWDIECQCPRCKDRQPADVIAEIIGLIAASVKKTRPKTKVVAWDWSWNMYYKPPYKAIVKQLPKDVILMGDFERGGIVNRAGKQRQIEEYSLMYPGPSKRFSDKIKLAKKDKQQVFAKLQINTTHELATVPSLPLVVSLYRKFSYLNKTKISGTMMTWNFACSTDTLNVFAVQRLANGKLKKDEKSFLTSLAQDYFGKETDVDRVVKAWYGFSRACYSFPLGGSNNLLYFSPINYALVYPLKLHFENKPMGPSWLKHDVGDRLEDTAVSYSLGEIARLFVRLSIRWADAVADYEKSLSLAHNRDRVKLELATAKVSGALFRSSGNIYSWYLLRKNKHPGEVGPKEKKIIADELENLKTVLPFVQVDRRMGYHQEAKWQMFNSASIRHKIRVLENL